MSSLSDMSMEQWKDIPGYEGLYQASTLGRIRTCEGKTTTTAWHGKRVWKQRIMKQKLNANRKGRIDARVCLWKDGKEKTWLVSRLVAKTWVAGYADGLTVNHIDGNPLNNACDNLEWVSRTANIQKGFADGLYSQNEKPVILETDEKGIAFLSMASASRFLGRNDQYVSNCVIRHHDAISVTGERYRIIV